MSAAYDEANASIHEARAPYTDANGIYTDPRDGKKYDISNGGYAPITEDRLPGSASGAYDNAMAMKNRAQLAGIDASERTSPFANYNGGRSDAARSLNSQADAARALLARNQQGDNISQLQLQAAGQGPSAAQALLGQANANAGSMARSQAASARGTMGQALAGRQAVASSTDAAVRAGGQSAILRAQEQQAAQAQLGQALNAMRAQDMQSRGAGAQESQFNAGLELQNRGLNDAQQMNYEKLGSSTYENQMNRASDAAMNDATNKTNILAGIQRDATVRRGQDQASSDNAAAGYLTAGASLVPYLGSLFKK